MAINCPRLWGNVARQPTLYQVNNPQPANPAGGNGLKDRSGRAALAFRGLGARQIGGGGAVEQATIRIEARTVARAVPRPLGVIPGDRAAEMRTHRGALVDDAGLVAVDGDLR